MNESAVPASPVASPPIDLAGELVNVALILAVVIAAFLAVAWLLRRAYLPRAGGLGALRVESVISVGGKERLMVVQASGERFLLGVAPSGVSMLHRFGPDPGSDRQDFHDALRRQGAG